MCDHFRHLVTLCMKHRKYSVEYIGLIGPNHERDGDANINVCLLKKVCWKRRGLAGHRCQFCTWQNCPWNSDIFWVCCLYFKWSLVSSCLQCEWHGEVIGWDFLFIEIYRKHQLLFAAWCCCCFQNSTAYFGSFFSMSLETKTKAALYNCA